MRNSRGGLSGIPCPDRAGATPASARSRRGKAHEEVSSPTDRPHRRMEISAFRVRHAAILLPDAPAREIATAAPSLLPPGPAVHVQGRLIPRRGWKWWTCGNGGMLNFHWAAGSHFQTGLVKMPEL